MGGDRGRDHTGCVTQMVPVQVNGSSVDPPGDARPIDWLRDATHNGYGAEKLRQKKIAVILLHCAFCPQRAHRLVLGVADTMPIDFCRTQCPLTSAAHDAH